MDHAYQLSPPRVSSKLVRIVRGLYDIALAFPRSPGVVARALSPTWFGVEALRLAPFYRALPFVGRKPYDVVHCHFGPNGILGLDLRGLKAIGAPLVTQFWGYDVSSYVQSKGVGVYRHLFAEGELFLCCSDRIRTRIIELGCDADKAQIQYAGISTRKVPLAVSDLDGGSVRLLTVARLVEKKGIEYGLRAVARLIADYPKINYTIVGEGPEHDALVALSRELGISSHVDLVGAKTRETVAELMRTSHILLAPSVAAASGDEEGIPVVLMEALASGLPVVSTFHAGIPELITHGVSGLLAAERDPDGLAQQVRFMITHPDERKSMALAGRRAIEADFDIDKLNARLLAQYKRLAKTASTS